MSVTPIRPEVKVPKPKRKMRGRGCGGPQLLERLGDLQQRVAQAQALARSLAIALEGKVLAFELEPAEGCLGVATLLAGVNDELLALSLGEMGVEP